MLINLPTVWPLVLTLPFVLPFVLLPALELLLGGGGGGGAAVIALESVCSAFFFSLTCCKAWVAELLATLLIELTDM